MNIEEIFSNRLILKSHNKMFAKFLIDVILRKKYRDSQKCYSNKYQVSIGIKDTIKYPFVTIVRIPVYRDLS